jgi:SAM-dependent methyltransferase
MRHAVDGYAPGYSEDALEMMTSRTAEGRAAFFLPSLSPGMRVLDAGCGPGTITYGLARAVLPGGSCTGVDGEASQIELARAHAAAEHGNLAFEAASIYGLPFAGDSFDAVFSHAVFEHLARPQAALAELRRVLRPGGVLGICSSDWGDARIEPRGEDVDVALRSHFLLRRRAGGDPYAGAHLPGWIEAAGLHVLEVTREHRVAMPYRTFARYIGSRIGAAAREAPDDERNELLAGAAAAARWAEREAGQLSQPWTSVLARSPQVGRRKASSPSRR